MRRLPPYARSTAASNTCCEARQMSGPVPSPSMKGMIGVARDLEPAVRMVMASPVGGSLDRGDVGAVAGMGRGSFQGLLSRMRIDAIDAQSD